MIYYPMRDWKAFLSIFSYQYSFLSCQQDKTHSKKNLVSMKIQMCCIKTGQKTLYKTFLPYSVLNDYEFKQTLKNKSNLPI